MFIWPDAQTSILLVSTVDLLGSIMELFRELEIFLMSSDRNDFIGLHGIQNLNVDLCDQNHTGDTTQSQLSKVSRAGDEARELSILHALL